MVTQTDRHRSRALIQAMPFLVSDKQRREDSINSLWLSIHTSSTSKRDRRNENSASGFIQNLFRKRKRTSPSPTPSRRSTTSTSAGSSISSARSSTGSQTQTLSRPPSLKQRQQSATARPSRPAQRDGQPGQNTESISTRVTTGSGPRRGSTRARELLPPQDFTTADLQKSVVLLRPSCRLRIGCVS